MGGFFEAFGGGNTVPEAASGGGGGTIGICFDGNDYMQHVVSPARRTIQSVGRRFNTPSLS